MLRQYMSKNNWTAQIGLARLKVRRTESGVGGERKDLGRVEEGVNTIKTQ